MCYYYYQIIIIIIDTFEERIEYQQSKRRKLDGQNTESWHVDRSTVICLLNN